MICSEIAPGKFISMSYVVVDPTTRPGRVARAGAIRRRGSSCPDGSCARSSARGLVLGIEAARATRRSHDQLAPGASLVLYTDGVIEARRDGELYGDERLDALLARPHALPARALADAVADDCRDVRRRRPLRRPRGRRHSQELSP